MAKTIKIVDLIPDDKNFNKGSEYGSGLIEKSFNKFGAGRSILIDKNNKIIAGNKSTEHYAGDDVIVIESDGTKLIAVKRTDIDLDTPLGREMALADNATAKANIVWAEDVIASELGVEVGESWGVDMGTGVIDDFFKNESNFSSLGGRITYRINRIGLKKVVDVSGSINIEVALDNFPFRFGRIDGDFIVSYNNLVTLKGAPNYVDGNFIVSYNNLVTLKGAPNYVDGDFDCAYNELVSLEGCPSSVGGGFDCNGNKLVSSFSGLVSCSRFYCDGTLLNNIWSLFSDVSKLELFNDYDIIRGDGIILDRLNSFLQDIGKEPVSGVEGYKNI